VTWLRHLADSPLQIIDFGEGKDGELYVLDHGGTMHRLVPSPATANARFPRKLSETGLFASVKEQTPAPGVLAYSINAEPWADHATAERCFAVPGGAPRMGVYEKQNLQVGHVKGAWVYPTDTVFAKTVSLEMERGNPASRRRLETQVLHRDGEEWRAYNYVWNDEQTDAVLAGPDGSDRTFTIKDASAPGGRRQQTWHFASRTECLVCHTTRAGSILGFNVPQLNRDHVYGDVTAPQLRTLEHVGLFADPLRDPLPRIANPSDPREGLNDRARAYLHANCAHCHRRGGGGTAPFELLYGLSLAKLALVGTRPSQGAFEIRDAENVTPGDPFRSVLYYRMAKLGRGRMPHAGSGMVDEKGLELIHDWIANLPATSGRPAEEPSVTDAQRAALKVLASPSTTTERKEAAGRLLGSTSGALYLLRAIDTHRVADGVRDEVTALAAAHPEAAVRDLFERFTPEEQRVKRLGTVVKAADILALKGDATRGRQLFFKGSGAQCQSCHRVQNEGGDVGPDLSQIGKKYDRAKLLESILEPSKTIEPAYVAHLVATKSGAVYSGLLVRKSDAEVVLKDAQGKIVTVPARELEDVAAQPKSLMPELLVRDLTAQEVADLLEFLGSLR
jgi:putative heme-binding domain-containing protein